MGFRSLKSWFKGLLCISGGGTESQWDWRDDHYDETLNEQDLLDLQETIESHPGLLILQGHQLRKYEERLAGLARIYHRTAALPCPKDEGYAPARAFPEGVEHCRALPQAVGEITEISVTATAPLHSRPSTFETVHEEEPILRPLHLADDINRLETEVVSSFSPKQLARGSVKLEGRKNSLSERSKIHSAPVFPPQLLRRTLSVAGSSDFFAEEVQTPCQPGMSPSGDSLSDASAPPPSLSPRIETTSSLEGENSFTARQHLENLGTAFSPFHDKQPLHVTVSKDYDVIQGQKPSRPLSGDPLQEELLFHSDGPPLSPNSETVRSLTSAYNRERASPEWKVKNAVFAAADIRATSDSAGSMWEDDNLTRLIPEKVESSKLVFDKGCA